MIRIKQMIIKKIKHHPDTSKQKLKLYFILLFHIKNFMNNLIKITLFLCINFWAYIINILINLNNKILNIKILFCSKTNKYESNSFINGYV